MLTSQQRQGQQHCERQPEDNVGAIRHSGRRIESFGKCREAIADDQCVGQAPRKARGYASSCRDPCRPFSYAPRPRLLIGSRARLGTGPPDEAESVSRQGSEGGYNARGWNDGVPDIASRGSVRWTRENRSVVETQ